MALRVSPAAGAVCNIRSVMDFLICVPISGGVYLPAARPFSPTEEIQPGLVRAVRTPAAVVFMGISIFLVHDGSPASGALLALLLGLDAGISMGYGDHAVMAIPSGTASVCFPGPTADAPAAGIITGLIAKDATAV